MPFYIAWADADHSRNTTSETMLSPGPGGVDYPIDLRGTVVETTDGSVILQSTLRDPRRRAWLWNGYQGWMPGYQRIWNALEPLRSRSRREAGLSPFVYVKDTATSVLVRRDVVLGTVSSQTGNQVFTDTGATFSPSALIGYGVQFPSSGVSGVISANTATSFTTGAALFAGVQGGEPYVLTGYVNDWVRCRVLDVRRKVADGKSLLTFEWSRFEFVIDDPNWASGL